MKVYKAQISVFNIKVFIILIHLKESKNNCDNMKTLENWVYVNIMYYLVLNYVSFIGVEENMASLICIASHIWI